MKKLLLLLFIISTSQIKVTAQCSITKTRLDADMAYMANAESIYKNTDLENGILGAYFQLVAIQNGSNKDLLMFSFITRVVSKRPKAPLAPRKITFSFEDNTQMEVLANDIQLSQPIKDITQNQCTYHITSSQFMKFQSTKIREIIITDTRTDNIIRCTPYNGLIQEQANCIANKIE